MVGQHGQPRHDRVHEPVHGGPQLRGAHEHRPQVAVLDRGDHLGQVGEQRLAGVGVERDRVAELRGPQRLEHALLELRLEGEHVQRLVDDVRRRDRRAERPPGGLDQRVEVLGAGALQRQRLEDPHEVPDGHALVQQLLEDPLDLAEAEHRRGELLDDDRVGALDDLGEHPHVLAAEQLGGVLGDDLGQVRGDHRGPVDDRGAGQLGLAAQTGRDPPGLETEDRLPGRLPGQ